MARHERIGGGARADVVRPRHLGADEEGVDAAGRRAEMGVVQHHAAQAPVVGVPVQQTAAPETRSRRAWRRRTTPRPALRPWRSCRRSRLARRRRTGDPSPPGIGGLARSAACQYGSAACCRAACPSGRTGRRSRAARAPSAPGSRARRRCRTACRHRRGGPDRRG